MQWRISEAVGAVSHRDEIVGWIDHQLLHDNVGWPAKPADFCPPERRAEKQDCLAFVSRDPITTLEVKVRRRVVPQFVAVKHPKRKAIRILEQQKSARTVA